jgi:hypothetical protein
MTFSDFVSARYCTRSARGDFVADVKSWIGAGIFPHIEQWSDLYRFLTSQNATSEKIEQARKMWRGFKKAVPNE